MVKLSTAQITGLISLALIVSGTVVVGNLEKSYYCEPEDNVKECLRVSSSGITCYYLGAKDLTKGDRCTGGVWENLDDPLDSSLDIQRDLTKVRANGKDWICDNQAGLYSRCKSGPFEAYLGELI